MDERTRWPNDWPSLRNFPFALLTNKELRKSLFWTIWHTTFLVASLIVLWREWSFGHGDGVSVWVWGLIFGVSVEGLLREGRVAYRTHLASVDPELPVWIAMSTEDNCVFMNSRLARMRPSEFARGIGNPNEGGTNWSFLFRLYKRYLTSMQPPEIAAGSMYRCVGKMLQRGVKDAELGKHATAYPVAFGVLVGERYEETNNPDEAGQQHITIVNAEEHSS